MKQNRVSKRIHIVFGAEEDFLRKKARMAGMTPSSYVKKMVRDLRIEEEPLASNFQTETESYETGKTTSIIFRFTPSEKKALEDFAQQNGLSRQRAAVLLIRSGLTAEPFLTDGDLREIAKMIYEINKVGVNINQIAHVYNELWKAGKIGLMDPARMQKEVKEGLAEMKIALNGLQRFLALKNCKHPLKGK